MGEYTPRKRGLKSRIIMYATQEQYRIMDQAEAKLISKSLYHISMRLRWAVGDITPSVKDAVKVELRDERIESK